MPLTFQTLRQYICSDLVTELNIHRQGSMVQVQIVFQWNSFLLLDDQLCSKTKGTKLTTTEVKTKEPTAQLPRKSKASLQPVYTPG